VRLHELNGPARPTITENKMPENWIGFAGTLREMRAHPLGDFTPVRTPEPDCPRTVRVGATRFYSSDGSNMFLLDERPQPDGAGEDATIYRPRNDWIRKVASQPVVAPLGWSLVMGRPLFWLQDDFVLPGHIVAWVLWRHRDTATIWRAGGPGNGNTAVPGGVWSSEDTEAPALAYLMPFPAHNYPRWSELRHDGR